MTFENTSEAPTESTRSISFTINDGDGNSNSHTRDVDVVAVNDAPTLDNSGTPTLPTITEDDVNNGGMTVADLLATGAGGDPVDDVDGDPEGIAITTRNNGRGVWQFSIDGGTSWGNVGTVSDSSALLLRSTDLVRFEPDGNNGGVTQTIEFRAWDQTSGTEGTKVDTTTNGGSSAFSTAIESASITSTHVNDAPVLDNSGTINLNAQQEDSGTPVGAVGTVITDFITNGGNVTDVDASSQAGIAITAADTTNGTWWYSTDGGTNWNALGAVSDSSARVLNASSTTRIYFEPTADFNGTISDAITFRAWDRSVGASGTLQDASTSGGATAFSTATETADLTINAVNDDPTNSGSLPTDITVTEDVLSDVDLSAINFSDVDAGSSSLTVTLSTSTGGELTVATGTGITLGGTATARTFTGTLTDLNNYFDTPSNVQYLHSTTHLNGDDADTITVVINDGGNTGLGGGTDQNLGTVNVDITAVNDAPLIGTNTGTTVAEGGSVTITTAMLNEADVDDAGAGLTYTVTSSPTNGQLELTTGPGVAITSFTQDDIDNNRVIFVHDGTQAAADSFDFSLADGGEDGSSPATGTFNFTVTNVNDAPVLSSIESTALDYDEGDGAVAITSALTLSDIDDTHLESATVSITAGFDPSDDVLEFTDQNGISGSYDSINGILTLTGTATVADYETALRSVQYHNTNAQNPDTTTRTIEFVVNDGDVDSNVQSRDVTVTAINDDPTNNGTLPASVSVVEDTQSNVVFTGFSLRDVDGSGGHILTIKLSTSSGGLLFASDGGGVTVTGNNSGLLTLSGNRGDLNTFMTTAGQIQYQHGVANTNGTGIDTITVVANDNGNTGVGGGTDQTLGSVSVDIAGVNDDPTNSGSLPSDITVTEDVLSNVDLSAVDFSDVDAGSSSLTVTLSTSTGGELTLAADGSLTFGGTATARTITGSLADLNNYFDTASNIQYQHGTTHTNGDDADTITVVINDNGNTGTGGGTDQTLGSVNVDITAVNDAPLVGTNTGTTVAEGGSVTITTAMLNEADVDDAGAGLTYTVTSSPTNGQLELTTGPGVAITSFTQDDIDNNRVIFVHDGTQAAADSFDFSLADGGEDGSTPATGTFNFTVTNVNDAPVLTVSAIDVNFTEQSPVGIDVGATISDVDDTDLEGAIIRISNNYETGVDELAFTNQNGITGVWDSGSGTLTLSGTASVADYQTALRSIVFHNNSDAPSTLTRTVEWTVNDGNVDSVAVTRDIVVQVINDDPINAGSLPSDVTVTEDVVTNVDLSAVDFSDVDAGSSDLTVTLSTSTGGELTLAADGSLTFGGTATARTITGTLTDLNNYFDTASNIQYQHPTQHVFGDDFDTISVVINDNGNTGTGGGTNQSLGSVNVDITAVNDAPLVRYEHGNHGCRRRLGHNHDSDVERSGRRRHRNRTHVHSHWRPNQRPTGTDHRTDGCDHQLHARRHRQQSCSLRSRRNASVSRQFRF